MHLGDHGFLLSPVLGEFYFILESSLLLAESLFQCAKRIQRGVELTFGCRGERRDTHINAGGLGRKRELAFADFDFSLEADVPGVIFEANRAILDGPDDLA